ncbi:hypothetical protein BaRGS_00032273 [Batillaria attramentaria]|uniref:Uncharacterized protein n=1 Tax=Batillaria attramentaria TaxID=370345 RepID=A0ABD0JN10_9CAEN
MRPLNDPWETPLRPRGPRGSRMHCGRADSGRWFVDHVVGSERCRTQGGDSCCPLGFESFASANHQPPFVTVTTTNTDCIVTVVFIKLVKPRLEPLTD